MRRHLTLITAALLVLSGLTFIGCDKGNGSGTGNPATAPANSPGGTGIDTTKPSNAGASGANSGSAGAAGTSGNGGNAVK